MADKCRSCGAPLFWAMTKAGKRQPIDSAPNPAGRLVVDFRLDGPPTVRQADLLDVGRVRYTSHFATCKDAEKWRKAK